MRASSFAMALRPAKDGIMFCKRWHYVLQNRTLCSAEESNNQNSLSGSNKPPRTAFSFASANFFSSSESCTSRALLALSWPLVTTHWGFLDLEIAKPGVVLLSSELISKPCTVHHRLLRLLLRVLRLLQHLVQLGVHRVHAALHRALVARGL